MLSLPANPKSGIFASGVTGKSSGRPMPFVAREMLPLLPFQSERVTLGPNVASLTSVGEIVVTRLSARFHEGARAMQPPGNCSRPMQVRFHFCIGLSNSVML